jgi:protein SCO1/2
MNETSSAASAQTVRRWLLYGLGLVALAAGVWTSLQLSDSGGVTKGYPNLGGDFTVQTSQGPLSLSDLRGKVVPIYFGYASCPDVCPTTLALLATAINGLAPDEKALVQGLFISVDPERDDTAKLEAYARSFHSNITGATAAPEVIADIARRYGAIYVKVEVPDSAMGYLVDHSSVIYVVDRHGKVRSLQQHGDSLDQLTARLQDALRG